MAADSPFPSIAGFPPEMVTAVAVDAARDAHRVHRFLNRLGVPATPEKPTRMPAAFLLHLGAALRLLAWEAKGVFVHREAGLPEARQAVTDAFRALDRLDDDPTELARAIMRLSIERFAWAGPPDLAADVALDEPHEDALLDALADFLWANRPR